MYADARKFLATVMPEFPTDRTAYINIHWRNNSTNSFSFPGRACRSIDDAIDVIRWQMGFDGDLYVCMSLQSSYIPRTDSQGNPRLGAVRSAVEAVSLRSLYVDIDVKESAYPDTDAAAAAFRKFTADTGMPSSVTAVASGSGGFHVHWTLDRALPRDEWQVLANALSNMIAKHGLIADTGCTVDAARLLRIPETRNTKTGTPVPTKILCYGEHHSVEEISKILEPYKLPNQVTASQSSGAPNRIPDNDDLGAGLEPAKAIVSLDDLAAACPFIDRTLKTGGVDNAQPLWFTTATIASFIGEDKEAGRQALHKLSDQHPTYKPEETDALYKRVSGGQEDKDIGWPRCLKVASGGAKECQTCPNFSAGKSPFHFVVKKPAFVPAGAAPATAQTLTPQVMPEGYLIDAYGFVSRRVIMDEQGKMETRPLCGYPFIKGWLSNNPWAFHFLTKMEGGREVSIEVPCEVIFAREGLAKHLGSKGFFCNDAQYKEVKEFIVSWIQKLQQSKDSVISAAPFGWSVVDGKVEGFSYAGRVWMDGRDRPAANPSPQLVAQYTPRGDETIWKDLAQVIYDQKRPQLDAILAVAFAAPLVHFTGFPGLLLNAYSSESGIGKTTAMKVSQAVWGHPTLAMQGLNDTTNSVLGKMGQIHNLPMYWDELKSDQQTKRFVSIVFDLTGGREKTRMNADTSLRTSGTWRTMLVSASNDSLVDAMAREVGSTTAGLHRMFEFTVPKPARMTHDVGMVQRLIGKLEDNFGHAGLIYSKFLGANWGRVEREVAEIQDEVCSKIQLQQEERNWAATIAVLLQGAKYSNELGLTNIDEARLKDFLLEVLEKMRGEVSVSTSDMANDLSVSVILAEFLNQTRAQNALLTNKIWATSGRPPRGTIQVLGDTSRLRDIWVQIGREDKLIRISSTAFSRWMADRGYSRQTFMKRMVEDFGLTRLNGKLGSGTDLVCGMERLLEIDGNDARISAILEI